MRWIVGIILALTMIAAARAATVGTNLRMAGTWRDFQQHRRSDRAAPEGPHAALHPQSGRHAGLRRYLAVDCERNKIRDRERWHVWPARSPWSRVRDRNRQSNRAVVRVRGGEGRGREIDAASGEQTAQLITQAGAPSLRSRRMFVKSKASRPRSNERTSISVACISCTTTPALHVG